MHANCGIGGAGSSGDRADARLAGELGVALDHERRAALLPANHEAEVFLVLVEAIEHLEVAFTGHAEGGVNTVGNQCIGDQMTTGTGGNAKVVIRVKLNQMSSSIAAPEATFRAEATTISVVARPRHLHFSSFYRRCFRGWRPSFRCRSPSGSLRWPACSIWSLPSDRRRRASSWIASVRAW